MAFELPKLDDTSTAILFTACSRFVKHFRIKEKILILSTLATLYSSGIFERKMYIVNVKKINAPEK